jgi:hypothetical protein
MVDFPLPDCPTKATVFPLGISNEKFLSTYSSSYLNEILSRLIAELKLSFTMAFGLSANGEVVCKISKTRSAAASPFLTP